jgi:hypothetical protein
MGRLRWKSPLTSTPAWKPPDWICRRCFVLSTAWIWLRRRFYSGLIRQLFELDADYAEALWALDQPRNAGFQLMLRDTLAAD